MPWPWVSLGALCLQYLFHDWWNRSYIGICISQVFGTSVDNLCPLCFLQSIPPLVGWRLCLSEYNTFVKVGQLSSLIQIFVVFDPHTGVSAYLCSFSVWQYCVPPTRYKPFKDRDCDTLFYSLYYLFKSSLILKPSPFPLCWRQNPESHAC